MSDIFSIIENAYNRGEEDEIEKGIIKDSLLFLYDHELFYLFMAEAMAEFVEPSRPISEVITKYTQMFGIYLEDMSPSFLSSIYIALSTELLAELADYKEDDQDLDA